MAFHGFFWCYQFCIGSIGDGNVMCILCDSCPCKAAFFHAISMRFHGELCSVCQMAEIPKSSKGSFKNEVFKRSSSGTRDKNVRKQQKREDCPVLMLPAMSLAGSKPSSFRDFKSIGQNFFNNKLASNQEQEFVAGASGVDADNGSGSCNDPSVEISPKENSFKAAHKLDLNSTLPDLNEAAPPELMSIKDVDKGSNFQNGPSFVANDLLEAVQVVRKLEIEGHVTGIFRMKFLSFLGLKATAKERDVVRTFIRTMGDDPSCLAGQLIDSFSGVVNM